MENRYGYNLSFLYVDELIMIWIALLRNLLR